MKTLIIDIIPNVLVFIPFGIVLSLLFNNKCWISIFIAFLFSAFVELFQLITGIGGFTFIDILLNVLGTLVGYGINKLVMYLIKNGEYFYCLINYFSLTFILITIPVAIYIYYQVIINFYVFLPCFSLDNFRNLIRFN